MPHVVKITLRNGGINYLKSNSELTTDLQQASVIPIRSWVNDILKKWGKIIDEQGYPEYIGAHIDVIHVKLTEI